jgi:predicted NUDIX family NTP pyrophosphohydrolase
MMDLGAIRQKSGKIVHGWAVEGNIDPATMQSNLFDLEWPPFSGRRQKFPEVDMWVYFGLGEARRRLKPAQIPFLERLDAALGISAAPGGTPMPTGPGAVTFNQPDAAGTGRRDEDPHR